MSNEKEIDHRGTNNVICPYCGEDNGADDGDGPPTGEQTCINEECEKKFDCEPCYDVTYYTSKVGCWNGEPHVWRDVDFMASEDTRGIRSCKICGKGEWVTR